MKNFTSRILSAAVALIIFFIAVYYWQQKGVFVLGLFFVAVGSIEMAKLLFNQNFPKSSKRYFVTLSLLIFIIITQEKYKEYALAILMFNLMINVCYAIFLHRMFTSIEKIFEFVSKSTTGIVYTSFFPATMIWITQAENGMLWFYSLLGVVFAGDVGAYLFGITMGKNKIAPLLSPKKSIQGSIGGLLFSTAAGFAFSYLFPDKPLSLFLMAGFFGGALGQIGDFFESLIKRIAAVKDSGKIMPGHGGALDRLDGVLLASPLFYILALYF